MCDQCRTQAVQDEESVKWLAMLIRQGLKLIVTGIDARYGESRTERERREKERQREQSTSQAA